jgi:hypothetical protein
VITFLQGTALFVLLTVCFNVRRTMDRQPSPGTGDLLLSLLHLGIACFGFAAAWGTEARNAAP